ncbi:restriction endonuclease [Candidatus Cetobacterium colombiensis]|uniref:Restriction endonuclease n=1 Tax=Candidatus Cetobacterium colombiensis TaxID=3073100 RepID=A0ABU4WD79_9FUSO|nr:restriction endonuclease [Candidatus Cetobacterium colombiensis]MDX8337484.1 restriction endonuclease [Candidatus Cetobacterium colombiensis]
MRCFLFRINTENEEVRNDIRLGKLRQGWGKSGMSLLKNEEVISKEEWRNNFPEEWDCSDEYINRKYDNLKLMLEIKKDDVIIIPKFPTWDSLSVVKVEEGYKFEMPKVDDFGHYIKIDINSLKSFKYASNTFSNTVHSKLRAYQSPLNNVWNEEVKDAANILLKLESTENIIKIENIVKYNFEKNLEEIRNSLSKISNRDLESIVEKLFLNQGYSLESRNSYDGEGADADLVLTKCLSILEEVDESKSCDKIYIQIKHKNGLYSDREGIDQLNQIIKIKEIENGNPNLDNIFKVLVCSSIFSEELKELAVEENIILIDGLQLTRLMIKYL